MSGAATNRGWRSAIAVLLLTMLVVGCGDLGSLPNAGTPAGNSGEAPREAASTRLEKVAYGMDALLPSASVSAGPVAHLAAVQSATTHTYVMTSAGVWPVAGGPTDATPTTGFFCDDICYVYLTPQGGSKQLIYVSPYNTYNRFQFTANVGDTLEIVAYDTGGQDHGLTPVGIYDEAGDLQLITMGTTVYIHNGSPPSSIPYIDDTAVIKIPGPSVNVTLTANPSSVSPGDNVTFTATVTTSGFTNPTLSYVENITAAGPSASPQSNPGQSHLLAAFQGTAQIGADGTATFNVTWDGKDATTGNVVDPGSYFAGLNVTVTDGSGNQGTANATATVTVGEVILGVARIAAVGDEPLLDDNGDPLSDVYFDGDTGQSNPIAAVPSGGPALARGVLGRAGPTSTNLTIEFHLPMGSQPSSLPRQFVYRGVIPEPGASADANATGANVVLPDFNVTLSENARNVTQSVTVNWPGGLVRSAKLSLFGRLSTQTNSDFKKAAFLIKDRPTDVDNQNLFLPFGPALTPFAGTRVPIKVMERACAYADNQTTEESVRQKLTFGLFGWLCWRTHANYLDPSAISLTETYRDKRLDLSKFCSLLGEQCTATSAFLEIHCSALGVEMQNQEIWPVLAGTFHTRALGGWGSTFWGFNTDQTRFPVFTPTVTPRITLTGTNFIFHQTCVAGGYVHEDSFGFATSDELVNGSMSLGSYQGFLCDQPGNTRLRGAPFHTTSVKE